MKKTNLIKWGVSNALGVFVYVFLLSTFLNSASRWFGEADKEIVTPMAAIMLLVFSALVTGWLVLGKPLMLYLDGHKKDSLKLLFFTGASLFVFIFLTFLVLLLIK